jgi:CHAT domain-containing protein
LTALLRAQRSDPSFCKRDTKPCLISARKTQDTTLPILWNVEDEISIVLNAAKKANIVVNDAYVLREAIIARADEALTTSNLAHIACHGTQDTKAALSSGFCLSDGILTITRLMNLDLKDAFFAFLSACETAKGDKDQPDQTIHLAAAMLFVGFKSVVATMW